MVAVRHFGSDGWHCSGINLGSIACGKWRMSDELTGKRIVILGLARQGTALARFATEIGAHVVVSDIRSESELGPALDELSDLPVEIILGQHPDNLLDGTDILALSGGVSIDLPLVSEARRRGIQLTNDSLEFMKRTPGTVIGITGSAGKTTTTALTGATTELTSQLEVPRLRRRDRASPHRARQSLRGSGP